MKALLLTKPGSYKNMKYGEIAKPKLRRGLVRVKVEAVGLNPVDYKIADWGHPSFDYPVILGFDVAGVIEKLPRGENSFKEGDKVYFHTGVAHTGGFGEFVLADPRSVSRMPEGLSFIEAASIPCAGFTAYQALVKRMNVQPGKTILILGGSGGVGTFAIQIAASLGLRVIATCSTKNIEFLRALGAKNVIDYRKQNIVDEVDRITRGKKVDYVLDTVSPESAVTGMKSLCYGGTIACIAGLPDTNKLDPFSRAFTITNVILGWAHASERSESVFELRYIGDELGLMVANGAVHPVIDSVIGFDEIIDGLDKIAGRHVRGKIVATIGQTSERERESDERWAQEKPASDTVRIWSASTEYPHPDFFWNSFHWQDLTSEEKKLWKDLGWSAKSWRGDKAPPESFNTGWKHLGKQESKAAQKLGYSKETWDSETE